MSDDIQNYIKDIEKQNEKLKASLDYYINLSGGRYQIYIVDSTIDKIDFKKIIDYYISFGWDIQPKRNVEDSKRRWEYFCLPDKLRERIPGYNKSDVFSIYKQPFRFPYKSKCKTLFKKYGAEYIEAINKFNIMLTTQATLEMRLPLEIYDQWVNEYSFT